MNQKTIDILVTTCPSYIHLLEGFTERFNKFYGERDFYLICSPEPETTALLKAIEKFEIFILLHEDFYFVEPVNLNLLNKAITYMEKNPEVGKIGLQGIHSGSEDRVFEHDGFYKHHDNADYLCSLEAAIWRRDYFFKYFVDGEDAGRGETTASERARNQGETVLWTKKPVMVYDDAMRGGSPSPVRPLE